MILGGLATSILSLWAVILVSWGMTGSAGTAVDVLVSCDSSNGRRVWEEGGEKSSPIAHFGCLRGFRSIFSGCGSVQFC